MRKVVGWIVLCVLSALLAGCAAQKDVPVRIAVVNADTGEPVDCQVSIAVAGGTGGELQRELTAPLDLALPAGAYVATISSPDYHDAAVPFDAVDHRAPVDQVVRLERRWFDVKVVDGLTGEPLEGVTVTYGEATATTDTHGDTAFAFEGKGDISMRHTGYISATLTLEMDSSGEYLVIGKMTPRVLGGQVVDADSREPIIGARVLCGDQETLTDRYGRYALTRVAQSARLSVAAEGYLETRVDGLGEGQAVQLAPISQGILVKDDATGQALEGVVVSSDRDGASTDAAGSASVRIWAEDTLSLSLDGYTPLTWTVSAETAMSTERLALSKIPSLTTTLHLRHAETGRPITFGTVLLYQGEDVEVLRPDDHGDLTLESASSEDRIMVKAPSYRRVTLPVTGSGAIDVPLEPFDVRAVYIPFGALTLPDRIEGILDMVDASPELNGIVVDVKSDRARLAWSSEHPLAIEMDAHQTDIMDLTELLAECERRGIYAVARMVIFKDDLLAQARPERAVMRDTGEVYLDNEDLRWVDPFRQEVRDYNISLALEIAAMGWDEVQFDYLRFPSDGGTKGLVYQQESVFETRTAAMAEFVAQAHDALEPTSAFFSADIFGLTVWVDPARDMGIGQRMDDIAPYVDYLSPMLYPTTFGPGNLGFDDPGAVPYEVIYHSVIKTLKRTPTPVRPWLQAYSIGDYDYGLWELLAQKKGAEDAGSHGWIYWNSAGRYMPEMFQDDAFDLVEDLPEPPVE